MRFFYFLLLILGYQVVPAYLFPDYHIILDDSESMLIPCDTCDPIPINSKESKDSQTVLKRSASMENVYATSVASKVYAILKQVISNATTQDVKQTFHFYYLNEFEKPPFLTIQHGIPSTSYTEQDFKTHYLEPLIDPKMQNRTVLTPLYSALRYFAQGNHTFTTTDKLVMITDGADSSMEDDLDRWLVSPYHTFSMNNEDGKTRILHETDLFAHAAGFDQPLSLIKSLIWIHINQNPSVIEGFQSLYNEVYFRAIVQKGHFKSIMVSCTDKAFQGLPMVILRDPVCNPSLAEAKIYMDDSGSMLYPMYESISKDQALLMKKQIVQDKRIHQDIWGNSRALRLVEIANSFIEYYTDSLNAPQPTINSTIKGGTPISVSSVERGLQTNSIELSSTLTEMNFYFFNLHRKGPVSGQYLFTLLPADASFNRKLLDDIDLGGKDAFEKQYKDRLLNGFLHSDNPNATPIYPLLEELTHARSTTKVILITDGVNSKAVDDQPSLEDWLIEGKSFTTKTKEGWDRIEYETKTFLEITGFSKPLRKGDTLTHLILIHINNHPESVEGFNVMYNTIYLKALANHKYFRAVMIHWGERDVFSQVNHVVSKEPVCGCFEVS